jgi:hypothetical protein
MMGLQRRTVLLVAAGLAGILGGGRYGYNSFVRGPLEVKAKQVSTAEGKLKKTNSRLVAARAAELDVERYSARSLPGNPVQAQDQYQEYLIGLLQEAKIARPTISPSPPRQREGVYFVSFTVAADAPTPAFLQFLHSFYAAPRLQQIRRLNLNPIPAEGKGPQIRFSMTIEAPAVGDGVAAAPAAEEPPRVDPQRAFYAVVTERNCLFGGALGPGAIPPNQPEHTVLTAIVHRGERAEADVYDRGSNQTRRLKVGDESRIGGSSVRVLDLGLRDAVLLIDRQYWRWKLGSSFADRELLSPEEALVREIHKSRTARRPEGPPAR